jgi:hypothetical protein
MNPLSALQLSQLADQIANRWHIRIDPRLTPIEHVFDPHFWSDNARLTIGDLIRVEAIDGSYDFILKIDAKTLAGRAGMRVCLWPNVPEYLRNGVMPVAPTTKAKVEATAPTATPPAKKLDRVGRFETDMKALAARKAAALAEKDVA